MPDSSTHRQLGESVGAGAETAGFFASILSGFLLGFFGDRWLDTEPWLVVAGIVAGSAVGFWKMWRFAKSADEQER